MIVSIYSHFDDYFKANFTINCISLQKMEGSKIQKRAVHQDEQLDLLQLIDEANPLQKKQLRKVHSLFPLLPLPEFSYGEEPTELGSLETTSTSTHRRKQKSTLCNEKVNDNIISTSQAQQQIKSRTISPLKNSSARRIFKGFGISGDCAMEFNKTELRQLFQKPIYQFHKRMSTSSNKNFANLRASYLDSRVFEGLKQLPNGSQVGKESEDIEKQTTLKFQSMFESGNLAIAARSQTNLKQYHLLLHKDINTSRCTQWFFFKVFNKSLTGKITFNILNFFKNYSSYESGMKVCYCCRSKGYRWERGGQKISYRKTNIKTDKQKSLYCLSFTFQFNEEADETYFSYSFPYTYSQMDRFLFQREEQYESVMRRKVIGYSLGGNPIDQLTVTNFKVSSSAARDMTHTDSTKTNVPKSTKKVIFISARVHPGQTPSSFVMEGIIRKLLEDTEEMNRLRDQFIFKLIPMINPDGVINGNYRCSLAGYDLNRVWNSTDKQKFPETFAIKRAIENCSSSAKPFLYIDLHAHSKKKGAFMYGCMNKSNPYACRELPFLLWKGIPEFNYYQCNFSLNRGREGTSRLFVHRELGIKNSYTMEHSFCGPSKEKVHFTVKDYLKIGENLINTLQKYYSSKRKLNGAKLKDILLKELYNDKELLKVGEVDLNDSSDDSQLQEEFQDQKEEKDKPLISQANSKWRSQRPQSKIQIKRYEQNVSPVRTSRPRFYKANQQAEGKGQGRREKIDHQNKLYPKRLPSDFQPMPKVGLNLDDFQRSNRIQQAVSSYTTEFNVEREDCSARMQKREERFKSSKFLKSLNRYNEDEVTNLTNLFLPSVTSSSYKKYAKPRNPNKGAVLVGKKFLESTGILKEEIRSSQHKKGQSSGRTTFI